ncbi:MAG TPA: uracil phosphoribosyltransferase [Ignavibacteriaceae bacterium]|nr:uracil phosphoribosyltransferase [Ignavibacteriaceae bacterium]
MTSGMENVIILKHPMVKRDVTVLRSKETLPETFRAVVKRISTILAVEISKEFKVDEYEVETPLEKTKGFKLENEVVLVPVLRAGLGMVSGFLAILPAAHVGHIGLQRDESTLKPVEYYYKTPKNMDVASVILVDPMLATGGSASEALNYLKKRGARDVIFACLVAAPQGINKVNTEHPDVKIFCAALDRELNDKGYILPGLGDAGDRTFGTL